MTPDPFHAFVGIDCSGARRPRDPLPGLRVSEAPLRGEPAAVAPPDPRGWSREALFAWLAHRLAQGDRVLVGLDVAFSFPERALRERGLHDWFAFLAALRHEWRTDERAVSEALRERAPWGAPDEKRACERRVPRAKSPFFFTGAGNVGYATHAFLPWFDRLARERPIGVRFWPFEPVRDARCVLAEAYPALYRPRYLSGTRGYAPLPDEPSRDAQDADAIARWMRDEARAGRLDAWLDAPWRELPPATRALEGWILGA